MLQDQYRAIMQYSIPKELCQNSEKPPSHKASSDWFCIKCGAQNFKRRDNCFKCHASRMESEEGGSGSDEICNYVTKTIMLRNLDALTTEDSVMQVLTTVIPDVVKKVSGVCIGRDPLTSTSRGICYLGTDSTVDALALYGSLTNLSPPLNIDGKTVIMSYCKYNMGDTKKAHEQAITAAFPNASQPSMYTLSDVDSLAEYSASRYAKSVIEYQQYYEYYKSYFTQQITAGNSITLHQDNQMDAANAAAAVAQSAIQQMHANKSFYDSTHMAVPSGTDGKRYPIPDISKFTYDKSSGYHYDCSTGLYYDPNSSYYWNTIIQKYLYYDHDKLTYLLAPVTSYDYTGIQQQAEISTEPETKKLKPEKQDKVKVAKKIAKDMERWAKTLNQKKESTVCRVNVEGNCNSVGSAGSADIGYSVLEKKNGNPVLINCPSFANEVPIGAIQSTPLVAAYGESESSEDESQNDDMDFLDFGKLICNLCKRQLTSAEALAKHAKLSDLHKKNLELRRSSTKKADASSKIVYRDRAKERRMKYGDTDEPQPSKLKEKYLKARELVEMPVTSSVAEPIGSENVGNRLLQKMGWTEGQGLGKANQGRTTIIQAEQRNSTVGLGNKTAYTAIAGESYKDCVKKMMYARYQELTDK